MPQMHMIDFTVGAWMFPAIVNDDFGGLDKHDIKNVETLYAEAKSLTPEGFTFSHFMDCFDELEEFGLCEISGLRGAVGRIQAVYLTL